MEENKTGITEQARLELIGGLRQLQREHHESPDCWYSCPKSEDGCCDDARRDADCDCGADRHNALVDDLLSILGPVDSDSLDPRDGL